MMRLYAVVDKKAKNLVAVFPSLNDDTAERSFLMLLTGPKNIYTDFPEDFDLYPVAELKFDSSRLIVSAHGLENVNSNGFSVDTFTVSDPVKLGSDYDKRYLSVVRADRYSIPEIPLDNKVSSESEVSSDA